MSENNLHKLKKSELLQIIYEQEKDLENKQRQIDELNKELENREITIKNAGSIAEASLKLNKIFEEAQKAADEYVKNVQKMATLKPEPPKEEIPIPEEPKVSNKKKKKNSKKEKNTTNCLALVPINSGLPYYQKPINPIFLKIILKLKSLLLNLKKLFLKLKNILNPKKIINSLKKNFHFKKKKLPEIKLKDYDLSINKIEKEIKTQNVKDGKVKFAKTFTYLSIIVIAIAVILSTRIFNVLQVSGDSMEPGLKSGSFLLSYRFSKIEKGDIIAFYYDDKVLIKRVVATGGDTVYIDDEGNLYINTQKKTESYIKNKSYEKCDTTFPIRVPENEYFVLGDNRKDSVDSRIKSIGTISKDKILGKVILTIKK